MKTLHEIPRFVVSTELQQVMRGLKNTYSTMVFNIDSSGRLLYKMRPHDHGWSPISQSSYSYWSMQVRYNTIQFNPAWLVS